MNLDGITLWALVFGGVIFGNLMSAWFIYGLRRADADDRAGVSGGQFRHIGAVLFVLAYTGLCLFVVTNSVGG